MNSASRAVETPRSVTQANFTPSARVSQPPATAPPLRKRWTDELLVPNPEAAAWMAPELDDGSWCEWSVTKFLDGLPLNEAIAKALVGQKQGGEPDRFSRMKAKSEALSMLRELGKNPNGRDSLVSHLKYREVLEAIAEVLFPALRSLHAAGRGKALEEPLVPPAKLHTSCVVDKTTSLSLPAGAALEALVRPAGSGGLSRVIGRPSHDLFEGMRADHCDHELDSDATFTEPTYNITSTPRTEYYFVCDPSSGLEALNLTAYPTEDPSTIVGPARPRQALPLDAFDGALAEANSRLESLEENERLAITGGGQVKCSTFPTPPLHSSLLTPLCCVYAPGEGTTRWCHVGALWSHGRRTL